ncbi:sigma-70 family RNA polymerase sigma factor [Candidatus Uhrbacteria bacterium]|nr:sigma-70 family RNA polymerase sigma factor [Candidatus Uhrbacteria bacterium]
MKNVTEVELQLEKELLARAKENPAVVAEIYDRYADRLYGFLLKRSGHKETAEDLVSRVFIKFMEALPSIEWQGVSLGAYLYRSASNALIDHWRSASVRMDRELDENFDAPITDNDPSWHTELVLEKDKLLGAMKTLSPRDQQVLDLRFFGGLEPDEIAAMLGISPNHASVLCYRAIGRLRKHYAIPTV